MASLEADALPGRQLSLAGTRKRTSAQVAAEEALAAEDTSGQDSR